MRYGTGEGGGGGGGGGKRGRLLHNYCKVMRRRKRRGKGRLPKNYSTNSYIHSISTYLSPLF
jgi:hypothetical protein